MNERAADLIGRLSAIEDDINRMALVDIARKLNCCPVCFGSGQYSSPVTTITQLCPLCQKQD